MTRAIRPALIWALHFVAIYALISAACAPRQLMDVDVMRATASLITLGGAILVLFWLLSAGRAARQTAGDTTDVVIARITWWCALISLCAITLNLAPIAFLGTCTG